MAGPVETGELLRTSSQYFKTPITIECAHFVTTDDRHVKHAGFC